MRSLILLALALVASTGAAVAQASHAQPPYAGMQRREIKALDPKQVDDLKAGRGMGLALAAELNGYPGPIHVLELAKRLRLSPDQRARVQQLFDSMKAEAIPLGHKLLDQERSLDQHFADRTITRETLTALTRSIGETTAALRDTHLSYHLTTLEVLTPEQVRQYGMERGYGSKHGHRH
jgi:Spy/CpxP family protein refolding chaperone